MVVADVPRCFRVLQSSPSRAAKRSRPIRRVSAAYARSPSARAAATSAAGSARDASPPVCSTRPCPATARISSAAEPRCRSGGRRPVGRCPPSAGSSSRGRVRRRGSPRRGRTAPGRSRTRTGRSSLSSSPLGSAGGRGPGRGRASSSASWKTRASPSARVLCTAVVGVRHRALGERGGERRRLQRRVPRERRLLQQPHGERPAPPLVVRAALRAEQRPGEPVGLLGPHSRDPQQLPGVLAQLSVRRPRPEPRRPAARARRARRPRSAPRARRSTASARGGRRRTGRGRHGLRPPHGLRRGTARRRLGLTERAGHGLLAALHGPYGGEQIGGRPAELGPGL